MFAFEPVSETYDTLTRRTAQLDGVHLERLALGAEPGHAEIHLHEHSALNSLHAVGDGRRETIEIDTLDAVAERRGIEHVMLLKVDAEGHDLEVLRGASRLLRDGRVDIVQIEVGFGAPHAAMPALEQVQELLACTGHRLYRIENQCVGHIERPGSSASRNGEDRHEDGHEVLVYADALFVSSSTD